MNKKQIVFFSATAPYVMIYKIAKEFKKRNYETILVTISQKDKWDFSFHKDAYDKIICSNFQVQKLKPKNVLNMAKRIPYLIKAVYQMKKLTPYVVFGISPPNKIMASAMKFFKKYPLIYFPYDILSNQYPDLETALKMTHKKSEIKAEVFCFENADGILHKGSPEELDFLEKAGIKTNALKINFFPYCSDDFIIPLNKHKISKNGSLHLVYVGGLYADKENLKFYNLLFQKILNKKIHLHVYVKTQHLSKEEDKKNLSSAINPFSNNSRNCLCKTSELLIGPDGNVYKCHRDLYAEESPIGNIADSDFQIEYKYRKCGKYGQCHPCDVKLKTNYKQQLRHTSVEIKDMKKNGNR